MSFCVHHSCSDFLSLCPLYPTLQIRHPQLTPGTYASAVHSLNTTAILRLHNQPPMGEGRVLLSNKVTPGLVRWAGSVHMWAYVMNVCWTAGGMGCKVGDYIMMGICMVAMTWFQYERDGPGTKHWPVRCGQNTTGQAPKLCRGGESIWQVHNCRKLLCRA